ncbi:hypothetical protein [Enterobacter hormaechei]|uniref:hypothetical protein n=1 Tax=Enterobacter hormaechei TaxID=158836 RepID=UPI00316E27AD
MSFTDTANAKKYASIAETAAAQAKLYAGELESAPDYAAQAAASASAAASSAQEAIAAESVVSNLAISASESATSAAASAAQAGNAAAAAVGQCLRVPAGESISVLPAQSSRQDTFLTFDSSGNSALLAKGGVAILDSGGKIPVSMIPAVALSEIFVANSQAAMLALNVQPGDIAKRTDIGLSFALASLPASTLSNWVQLNDDVLAQLGLSTGATEVGAVDDLSNPTTVQGALNLKAPITALSAKVSISSLGANDGERFIGLCPDIATLRTVEPVSDGQRITLREHTAGTGKGGGQFRSVLSGSSYTDNNGTIIKTTGGAAWLRINADILNPLMFGALGDGEADDSAAFNSTMQAAKLSGGRGKKIDIPAPSAFYRVKDVNVDSAVEIIGSSKSSSLVKPVSNGDTCFIINSNFVTMSSITIMDEGRTTTSTGIKINEGYMTLCNCYIALIGTCISFAKNSGEHNMYNVRLVESKWGLVMPGGQVNSRFNGFVIGNVDGAVQVRETLAASDRAPTEGLVFTDCLIAGCGNPSESIPAVDITGTRWTWFNNTMVDLSKFTAVYVNNAESIKFTGGYLSSNQSANSPCLHVKGNSPLLDAVNLTIGDSRSWGIKLERTTDGAPDGARFTNLTAQNNDINASQQGDLLIDSVSNVCVYNSKFASQKPTGIAVIDNSSVGSSLYLDGCSMRGQAYVGGTSCVLINRNSPTHPEEQRGVVTIPNGSNTVSIPLKIVPFESGKTAGVVSSPSSGTDVITSGVQGANIVFNRVSTGAATTVSFYAFSTK